MKDKIRVLQVFGRTDRGGAETLIMNVFRNIDRDKVQFDFAVHTEDRCAFDEEIESLGGEIFRIPRYKVFNHYEYVSKWKELFEKNKGRWDVVHGHMFTTASIYLEIARFFELKTIVHSHSNNLERGIKYFSQNLLTKNVKKFSDYLLSCSNEAGEWLFGKGSNFIVFKNGIDVKNFLFNQSQRDFYRKKFRIEKKLVIGHVGSIYYPKNHEFLIDVFFEIQKLRPNSVLLLIGDGILRKKMENKVKNYGIEGKVIFLGVVSNVNEILNAMDIFVFPSLLEGLPVTLIEAQANGLKCIISDRITKEVKITDLVEFLPLEKGAKYWADYISNSIYYERKNRYDEIVKSGYDIKENTKWLENFYLDIVNKK